MSKEREVANVPVKSTEEPKVTAEEVTAINELSDEEYTARLATVLDRGLVSTFLSVDLPADLHGEWVSNHPIDIDRLKALGFEVDTQYASAMHGGGSGEKVVGDVIHMVQPMRAHLLVEEFKAKRYQEMHGKKTDTKIEGSKEERDFKSQVGLPVIDESSTESVNASQIEAALKG